MKWFGDSWGAPVCEPEAHTEAPVGMVCAGHDHMHENRSPTISADDQGVLIPHLTVSEYPLHHAWHLDCWLHEIGADRVGPTLE